jgi:hypothetical protein
MSDNYDSKPDGKPTPPKKAAEIKSDTPEARSAGPGNPTPMEAASKRSGSSELREVVPGDPEYIVFSSAPAGLQTMSVDLIGQHLGGLPGVKIKRRISRLGLGAASADDPTADGFVIEASAQQALALKQTAARGVIVEPNRRLHHFGMMQPQFLAVQPMLADAPLESKPVQLRIVSAAGDPVSRATITLWGLGFAQQAVTDQDGLATLPVFGGDSSSVSFVYVKPFADYWERWLEKPALDLAGVNTVTLQPILLANGESAAQHASHSAFMGWGQRLMDLPSLVAQGLTGKDAKVAIIDSGCDTSHPALTHITQGYDFTNTDSTAADTSWRQDAISHGTHCAGIIAGNGDGIRGFVPEAEVHILKLFPGGAFDSLMAALAFAVREGVDVVNCSLGSDQSSQAVAMRMEQARQAGVAVVVAAGNSSGPVQFPANLPGALAVSAIGQTGDYPADTYHAQTLPDPGQPGVTLGAGGVFSAKFTCFGPEVRVCAPGVAIVSSVPGGGYAAWDGTSMAAPHITGLAALVAAHHPEFADRTAPRNAARVDRLFQIVMGIARSVGLAAPYAGAGLPGGHAWTAVNGRLVTAGADPASDIGAVPPVLAGAVQAIVAATVASMQAVGVLGRGSDGAWPQARPAEVQPAAGPPR